MQFMCSVRPLAERREVAKTSGGSWFFGNLVVRGESWRQ